MVLLRIKRLDAPGKTEPPPGVTEAAEVNPRG